MTAGTLEKEQERRHGARHRACDQCRIFRRDCYDARSAGRRGTKLRTISVKLQSIANSAKIANIANMKNAADWQGRVSMLALLALLAMS